MIVPGDFVRYNNERFMVEFEDSNGLCLRRQRWPDDSLYPGVIPWRCVPWVEPDDGVVVRALPIQAQRHLARHAAAVATIGR